jgi:hypothetical protein
LRFFRLRPADRRFDKTAFFSGIKRFPGSFIHTEGFNTQKPAPIGELQGEVVDFLKKFVPPLKRRTESLHI